MKTQRASETKEQITPRTCTICSKNIGGRNYTGKMMVCSEKCKQTALLFGAQEEELVVYLPIEAALRKVVISAIKNRVGPKDITQFIDHTFQFMPPLKYG